MSDGDKYKKLIQQIFKNDSYVPHIVFGIHEADKNSNGEKKISTGEDAVFFWRVIKEGLRDKMTFEQKPKESEGIIQLSVKRIPRRGNNIGKHPDRYKEHQFGHCG